MHTATTEYQMRRVLLQDKLVHHMSHVVATLSTFLGDFLLAQKYLISSRDHTARFFPPILPSADGVRLCDPSDTILSASAGKKSASVSVTPALDV